MSIKLVIFLPCFFLFVCSVKAKTSYLVTTLYNEVKSSEIKCRKGDDLAWTSPELHDESWRSLDSVKIDELSGIWWFRLRVQFNWSETHTLLQPALSLLIFPGTAYELYADGALVTRVGSMPPEGRVADSAWARVHALPPKHEMTLALRVWYQPDFGGQLHRVRKIPTVKLGDYFHLYMDSINEAKDYKLSNILTYALALTFLVIGFYHLNLYTRNRKFTEYLWFGLFSITFSLNTAAATLWRAELMGYHSSMLTLRLIICLATVASVQFILSLLKLPITLLIKFHHASALILATIFLLGSNETLTGNTGNLLYGIHLMFTIAIVFWLIFFRSSTQTSDINTLRAAIFIMAGAQIAVTARLAFPIPERLERLMLQLPNIGFATLIFSMGIILSNRFLSVYAEIDTLNRDLERKVEERTQEVVRQRDEIEEKNQRILDSITYAESLQKTILPPPELLQAYIPETFIFYRPKDIVSGDFYYFKKTASGVLLGVFDCTGHGIAGAMISMMGELLLSQIIIEKQMIDPAKIFVALDNGIHRVSSDHLSINWVGMEAAICLIDEKSVHFAGAGRPLYYTNRLGDIVVIKGTSRMLGSRHAASNFHSYQIPISEIDMLYLATDGYADQNGDFTPKYGSRRFQNYLKKISNLPTAIQHQLLKDEFESFKGIQPQRDDVTVLGLRLSK